MKKWLSMLMALVMVLSMASAALGEEATPAETPVKVEEPAQAEEPAAEAPVNKEETPSEEPDSEAARLSEIQDALNPDRSIRLFARWEGEQPFLGDEVRLRVELKGYDGVDYTLEWQYNVNPADPKSEWKTYVRGSANAIAFTLDETNCEYCWRVLVNITGVRH